MTRLAMPDSACVGVEIEGARTGAVAGYYNRIVEVDNPQHEKTLRAYGCFPANVGGTARGGFICSTCSFRSYFRHCSRCGGECERGADASREENHHDAVAAEAGSVD